MGKILLTIYYIVWIITFGYYAYFLITGFLGIIKKNKIVHKENNKNHHFAILIAARNEANVIGNLIESLKKENYPQDKYDIYVIPNNCTDNTKEVAEKAGAKIIDCTVKTKTKGDVLKFTFEKLKKNKEIDAYIVFDADNVVHPDFLKNMNDCLVSGYRVAEGFRDAKNPTDNWISSCYTIFYLYQNIFFNRSRMGLNASSSINGTGFMIKKELIDKDGFETFSLTEDVEFSGQCALKKEQIAFVDNAITYDEYPTEFTPSWKQRKRWSAGIITCRKLYSWKLLKHFFKTRNFASLDMSLIYWGPIVLVVNFINLIALLTLMTLHWIDFSWSYLLLTTAITYICDIMINIFMFSYYDKKVLPVMKGIILFPIFIITWIPINILCLIKKHTTWEEIKHNRVLNINDIMKK